MSLFKLIAGDDSQPAAKRSCPRPDPGKKMESKQALKKQAGQKFLKEQLAVISEMQALQAAKNNRMANHRAAVKLLQKQYDSTVDRQQRRNDRLFRTWEQKCKNNARMGLSPPSEPQYDETEIVRPVIPAAWTEADDSVPDSPEQRDPAAEVGPNQQPFNERYRVASP